MKILNLITLILVIVGALNWGLVALDFNLVTYVLGVGSALTTTVYILVGISAIWQIIVAFKKSAAPTM